MNRPNTGAVAFRVGVFAALAISLIFLMAGVEAHARGASEGIELQILTSSEFDMARLYQSASVPDDLVPSLYAPARSYYELLRQWKEQHPEIKLVFDEVYWEDMTSKLLVRERGGNPPDVFVNNEVNLREIHRAGLSANLKPYADDWNDFSPGLVDACREGDFIFSRPWMTDSRIFYYWKDLLAGVGARVPETWDEVINVGKKLTKDANGDGTVDQWGLTVCGGETVHTSALILPWVWMQGGDVTDANYNAVFNTPEMRRVFGFLSDAMNVHKIAPTSLLGGGEDEFSRMFTSRSAAMQYFGDWRWGMMMDEVGENTVLGNIGYARYPKPDANSQQATLSGFYAYQIYSRTNKKDAAWAFIKHMTSTDAQVLGIKYQADGLPTRKSVMQSPEVASKTEFWRFSADYVVGHAHTVSVPKGALFYDALKVALQKVLRQEMGIEDALKEAEAKYNQ